MSRCREGSGPDVADKRGEESRMAECEHKNVHERLFRGLLERTLSNAEVAEPIQIMLTFEYEEVGRQMHHGYWRLDELGLSQRDVANDSMAGLLAWDGKKPCGKLRRSLAAICTFPEHFVLPCGYIHGLVRRCVRQEFCRILSEDNATHTNLLRALDHHRKKTPGLKHADSELGRVYSLAGRDILKDRPFMPVEELLRRIPRYLPIYNARVASSSGGHPTNPVVQVLTASLSVLAAQEDYRREVPERDVLHYTKMWPAAMYKSGEGESSEHGIPEREENELRAGIEAALDTTGAWVRAAYVGKGKLTMPVAEAMLGAIREWISDCLIGIAEEPAVYFRRNEGMSSAEYRATYRSIYLNIVNWFRDELRTTWNRRR